MNTEAYKNEQSYEKHFKSEQSSWNSAEYVEAVESNDVDDARSELKEWGIEKMLKEAKEFLKFKLKNWKRRMLS